MSERRDQLTRFAQLTHVPTHRHTRTQSDTDHATCDICRNRSHLWFLCYACDAA